MTNQEKPIPNLYITSDVGTIRRNRNPKKNNQPNTKITYICEICNKKITGLCNYRVHVRNHTGERPYACDLCRKAYKRASHLKAHIITHAGKQNVCNICREPFTVLNNYKTHMLRHTNTKVFACNKCDKQYSDRIALNLHSETHKEDPIFQCSECNRTYSQKSLLIAHLKTHTGIKLNECPSSIKKKKKKKYLAPKLCKTSHITTITKNQEVTNKQSKTEILKNNKTHKKKVHVCEYCGKKFADNSNYRTHKRIHTGDRPYTCNLCPKAFKQRGHLKDHVVTHSGDKMHTCEKCHKSYTQSHSLKRHLRIHSSCDKTVQNLHSEKSFKQKRRDHIVTQSGDKLHTCETCHKSYTQLQSLKRHLRIHSSCDKTVQNFHSETSFKQKGQDHIDTHSGEKLHTCETCHKSYMHPTSLIRHMRSHISCNKTAQNLQSQTYKVGKIFQCSKCNKMYLKKSSLILHLKNTGLEPCHTPMPPARPAGTLLHEERHTKQTQRNVSPAPATFVCRLHFECDFCGKIFYEKKSIGAHLRLHMKQILYTCNVCDKKFSESNARKKHMKNHEKSKPVKIMNLFSNCFKTFTKQYQFEVDRKKHSLHNKNDLQILGF